VIFGASKNGALMPVNGSDSGLMNNIKAESLVLMVIINLKTSIFICNRSLIKPRTALDGINFGAFDPWPFVDFGVFSLQGVHCVLENLVVTGCEDDVLVVPVEEVGVVVIAPVGDVAFFEGFGGDGSLFLGELLCAFEGFAQEGVEGLRVVGQVVGKVVFEVGLAQGCGAELPLDGLGIGLSLGPFEAGLVNAVNHAVELLLFFGSVIGEGAEGRVRALGSGATGVG
jgi:hypothetical protein